MNFKRKIPLKVGRIRNKKEDKNIANLTGLIILFLVNGGDKNIEKEQVEGIKNSLLSPSVIKLSENDFGTKIAIIIHKKIMTFDSKLYIDFINKLTSATDTRECLYSIEKEKVHNKEDIIYSLYNMSNLVKEYNSLDYYLSINNI